MVQAGIKFLYHLYGNIFPTKVMPPTSPNFALHMKRAHHQVTRGKLLIKRVPPTAAAYIGKFGWNVRGGVVSPAIHTGSPALAQVKRELSCGCRSGICREESVAVKQSTYHSPHTASVQDSMCVAIHIVYRYRRWYRRCRYRRWWWWWKDLITCQACFAKQWPVCFFQSCFNFR